MVNKKKRIMLQQVHNFILSAKKLSTKIIDDAKIKTRVDLIIGSSNDTIHYEIEKNILMRLL